MPKQGRGKMQRKAKSTVSVRQARDLLTETTGHQEADQQIIPIRDPLSNFFNKRKLTADIEESRVLSFRPLNLDNATVFEVKTSDPAVFMDINSLRLTFEGTVKEVDSKGKPIDLVKDPVTVLKSVKETRMVTNVTPPETEDGPYVIKSVEMEVDHQREYMTGLLVTPSPMLPLTMWKRISVEIGDAVLPNTAKDMLGFQVYIRVLLDMKPQPMDSQLRSALFVLDSQLNLMPGDDNHGLTYRFQAAGNSKTFDFESPLMIDGLYGWKQNQLLPGTVPLRLAFERADPRLCLTAIDTREEDDEEDHKPVKDRRFTVDVEEALLHARCYKLSPAAYKDFQDQLHRQELQISYPSNCMDYRFIHKGVTSFRFQIPNSPCNPDRFWFCLLTPDQFRGSYSTNQFWWTPNGLKKISIDYGDGRQKVELDCDFETDRFSKLYNFFVAENNVSFTEGVLPLIPPDLYKDGRFGFVLDLSPNHSFGVNDIRALPSLNVVELTLTFKSTTPEELVFLHCSTREESLFVGKDLSVRLND